MPRKKKKKTEQTWPHDHSAKHARAARLGWERRKRRYGGSSTHTVKVHYVRQRKRSTPAPKPAPASPAADTYQLVATQKANGKWIVTRYYKSGKIQQDPKEYASNPLARRTVKQRVPKEQTALFGGAYERQQTYGTGLFGE